LGIEAQLGIDRGFLPGTFTSADGSYFSVDAVTYEENAEHSSMIQDFTHWLGGTVSSARCKSALRSGRWLLLGSTLRSSAEENGDILSCYFDVPFPLAPVGDAHGKLNDVTTDQQRGTR
jgi:hypothetical protein